MKQDYIFIKNETSALLETRWIACYYAFCDAHIGHANAAFEANEEERRNKLLTTFKNVDSPDDSDVTKAYNELLSEEIEFYISKIQEISKNYSRAQAEADIAETTSQLFPSMNDHSDYVTEWCPHCENEIVMAWNIPSRGYKAYCPVCGERLMLCDACQHDSDNECTDDCDYCAETDSCRHNRKPEKTQTPKTP